LELRNPYPTEKWKQKIQVPPTIQLLSTPKLFYIRNAAYFSTKFFYGFSRKSRREKTQTVLSPLAPIKIFIFLAFELPSGNYNFFIARAADSSKKADLSQPHPSSSTNW
jgi:hypothetical protein